MKTTVKEFAARHDIDNVMANSVLGFLVIKGIATRCESLKIAGKKGKPQNVFEVPATVTWDEPEVVEASEVSAPAAAVPAETIPNDVPAEVLAVTPTEVPAE